MKTIVKSIFGSHLYGINTKNSDKDYKGIYQPSLNDCILNKIEKSISSNTKHTNQSKNTENDIDEEIYSIQYFMDLAIKGEMIVIDMLHTPDSLLIESSGHWFTLKNNRQKFYSKNLHGYLRLYKKTNG